MYTVATFFGSLLMALAFFGVTTASAQALTVSGLVVTSITQSSADINWTTGTSSDSKVFYGTSTAYNLPPVLQTATTSTHVVSLTGLTASTTYHVMAQSEDADGNTATSSDYAFTTLAAPTPDIIAPVISAIIISGITQTSANIFWTTNEPASTQVEYGTSTAYGFSSMFLAATTTAHVSLLSSLATSTTYHVLLKSRDAADNLATSTDQTFTTLATPPTPPSATSSSDILAKLKIEPRTLNARSRGKWIEAEMTFPLNGYTATDVNVSSIKLNGTLSPERVKVKSKRHKSIISITMKFSRSAVIEALGGIATSTASVATSTPTVLVPTTSIKSIAVSGTIGTAAFGGTSTVRLISWSPKPISVPDIKKHNRDREREYNESKKLDNQYLPLLLPQPLSMQASTTTALMPASQGPGTFKKKKEESNRQGVSQNSKKDKKQEGKQGR